MNASFYLGIIICATCVGILTGISVSPILQAIITSLITIIVSMLSIATGINNPEKQDPAPGLLVRLKLVNVFPITAFVFFFTAGSFTGIKIRTANLLGESLQQQFFDFKAIGLSNDDIKDIIKTKYAKANTAEYKLPVEAGILFSNEIRDRMDLIRLATGKQLETELKALGMPAVDSFLTITNDSLSIEALKAYLCSIK